MIGTSKAFMRIATGQTVRHRESEYTITSIISVDSVLAVNTETKKVERLRVESIAPPAAGDDAASTTVRDLTEYSDEEWAAAQRRFEAIKSLLNDPIRSRESVEKEAQKADVHANTLYRWMKVYLEAGHVSALVPYKRGRKPGTLLLDPDQEAIIQSAIEDVYLCKQRGTAQAVAEEVARRCRLAKVAPPHANTVRNRIAALDPGSTYRKRGMDKAKLYTAIRGSFPGADTPLAVVQIDHTPADIIVVDEVHRRPLGRPWITLAICVFSRMVVGVYISLEAPNAAAVGICLSRAICPKQEYLTSARVSGDWPVWGVMGVVHADNGMDFKCKSVTRACDEYCIDMHWRPIPLPNYGGHIERLMGTVTKEHHKVPGTTFSNTRDRKGYKSEANAVMTLKEFETHIVDFLINEYHQHPHSELGMPPTRKWSQGVLGGPNALGTGLAPIPEDGFRVRLDFMPYEERTVQRYGVQIDNVNYYDPVLDPYINAEHPDNPKAKRKFLFRRDPRDISKVYFLDPESNCYAEIPYRNIGLPPISLWELREVLKHLKEEGLKDVDEQRIFERIERARAQIAEATAKTKSARRKAARIPTVAPPTPPTPSVTRSSETRGSSESSRAAVTDDPFNDQILPFDELSLTR